MNTLKKFVLSASLIMSMLALPSVVNADMNTFYNNPENVKKFKFATENKVLQKAHDSFMNMCRENDIKIDCDCYDKTVKSVPEKKYFYFSTAAYELYEKMKTAKEQGDEKELARLKLLKQAQDKEFEPFTQRMEKCEIKDTAG